MKFKKMAAFAAGAAVVALGLAACSASTSPTTGPSDVTLHVLSYGFDQVPTIFNAFTAETGVKVQVEQVGSSDYPSVLQSRVAAKADLDVIQLRGGSEFNKYAKAQTFTDITNASYLKKN